MSTKNWRPSWGTPGQSENSSAVLDFIVNRNLSVEGNITVDGKIIQPILSWTPYTPTVQAYTTAAGRGAATPILSTGMVYTSIGRWNQIGSVVLFYFDVAITTKGTGFLSNPYVDLPPVKPITQFSAQGVIHPNGSTDDSAWNQLFGYAKAGATQILVGPSSYASPTVLANIVFPLEFIVTGAYEAV